MNAAAIRGQIMDDNGVGVTHLSVELWEADAQSNIIGTTPLLRSQSLSSGEFSINLQRISPTRQLPGRGVLIFRDPQGQEVGQISLTPEMIEGRQTIHYEDAEISAPVLLSTWPKAYSSPRHISEALKSKLVLHPNEDLSTENAPQFLYFATYVNLPPLLPSTWPWPVFQDEIPDVPDLQQPFLLGVQVIHREEWNLLGCATGDLLYSLPLAPGEETTLELLTWDRNVYKREEEITQDLEREIEENRQFKDSREVLKEIEKTKSWKVGGGFSLNLKIFKIGADGNVSNNVKSLDRSTRSTIEETTDRASSKLRDQRKTLISSTREFGKEEKVTRKIVNTNRCHAVTYHYYELLKNYEIATSLDSPPVRPCIFVKQKPPISRERLLAEPYDYGAFIDALCWLNWNRHVIARGLLDRSFYHALELVPELEAYWRLGRGTAASADLDPLLQPLVSNVVESLKKTFSFSIPVFPALLEEYAPWLLYGVVKNTPPNESSLEEALDHIGQNQLRQTVESFLQRWHTGYPAIDPFCRNSIEHPFYRPYLFDPVMRLKNEYNKLVYGPDPGEEPEPEELERMRKVSEIIRLLRHIEQNYFYYSQVVWASKDPGEWILEASNIQLPGGKLLSEVIEPEVLGFYADYIVFPFTAATQGSDLDVLIQAFQSLATEPPSPPFHVVLPTNGIIMESQLGQNSACEPFIEQHRVYDLESKAADVQKANLDNQRRQKKIQMCELENPECCPSPKQSLFHRLCCLLKGREEG
jgi:hypothetical protein